MVRSDHPSDPESGPESGAESGSDGPRVPDGAGSGAGTPPDGVSGSGSASPGSPGPVRRGRGRSVPRAGAPPGRAAAPLVVTGDQVLLDDLLRLCAAAGAEPEVFFDRPPSARAWESAPLVLVGDDAVPRVAGAARRAGVLLIGSDLDDPGVWRRAVDIGAQQVLFLPDAERLLVDALADAAEGVGPEALTVGVIGGRGGAGASSLACALAVGAVRAGHRALLLDGDPLGGGIDLLLGGERESGLRWPDFRDTRGRVNAVALAESLPRPHDLAVLSFDRGDPQAIAPGAMAAVVSAARRRGGLVVIDLPRRADPASLEALARTDIGLLVVPAELRAVAAARSVALATTMVLRDLRVVVRGPAPSRMAADAIAHSLRLPLAGELDAEPGIVDGQERGVPPGLRRGPLAEFADRFLSAALDAGR